MEYFSDFNTISYHVLSNVFYTYANEGTEQDPDRYKFLIPKDIPQSNQEPARKQNLGIFFKYPRKQNMVRYQVLYNLLGFTKDRRKVGGAKHSVLLTIDIMDKGEYDSDSFSQDSLNNTSYLVEIANQIQNISFWRQTIELLLGDDAITKDYHIISLDTFHVGSIKFDDTWKDVLNINIEFQDL